MENESAILVGMVPGTSVSFSKYLMDNVTTCTENLLFYFSKKMHKKGRSVKKSEQMVS